MGVLDGRGAIVTGGSRGIGRAVVQRLVADGARVVFCYRADEDAAGLVSTACAGAAVAVRADLAEPGAVQRLYDAAERHLPTLDVVVNNAATVVTAAFADIAEEDYDRVMAVNTKAVFLSLRLAARRVRDGGRIITMSSANMVLTGPGVGVYAGSKAAVEAFTRAAARELGPRGVTVNVVSPGATDTDLLRGGNSAEALRTTVAMTPLGRLGEPADVADVVGFLAGPGGRWVTGQTIQAGGGLV